jgi:hypothetical protein
VRLLLVLTIGIVLGIIIWRSVVAVRALRSAEPKVRTLWQWIRDTFDALSGVG